MKFNTDVPERGSFDPFPPGEYDYEISSAEDTQSKAGNDMIHITLFIFNSEGHKRIVHDYLLDSAAWKIKQLAASCGMLAKFESGEIEAYELEGKTGRCRLRVESSEQYGSQNKIHAYIAAPGGTGYTGRSSPAPMGRGTTQAGDDLSDEIPFAPCWQ